MSCREMAIACRPVYIGFYVINSTLPGNGKGNGNGRRHHNGTNHELC